MGACGTVTIWTRGKEVHYEILVEDQSGKKSLEIIIPKIIDTRHTFKIHAYKGIGHLPKNMKDTDDASKRILLTNLPKLLKGYGRTFNKYPGNYEAIVVLVCDLDDRCLKEFRQNLLDILHACKPQPVTQFCFAIEEGEAWYLGDITAIKKAYPRVINSVLDSYKNDSICGTWEKLADAIYPGGSVELIKKGWQAIGFEKSKWAVTISPHMDIHRNNSASFCYFRKKLNEYSGRS